MNRQGRYKNNLSLTILAIILSLITISSCGMCKRVTDVQRDSVFHYIQDSLYIRDTVILWQIPPESGANVLPDSDTSFLQTNLAESKAYIENGKLNHTLRNRNEAVIPIEVKMPVKIHREERGLVRYLKTVERVEAEKELSKWQRFLQGLGWSVLVAGALWLAMKLAKIIRM